MEEAKERGRKFLAEVAIEGSNAAGGQIMTNLPYLQENIARLLTF